MARKSSLITDEILTKVQSLLDGMGNNAKGIIKLKAIVAAKEHGITTVAKIFNVSKNTITQWIKKLRDNPESIFKVLSGRGRKNKLSESQLNEVKSWISKNPSITIKQLINDINEVFGIELRKSAVHTIIKKLSFSYITPRPKHYKQDKSKHDAFKKKSTTRS